MNQPQQYENKNERIVISQPNPNFKESRFSLYKFTHKTQTHTHTQINES